MLGVLCVNKDGDFWIVFLGGYVVLFYVWVEGFGLDEINGGFYWSLVVQLFDKLVYIDIEWLWIDSLVILGIGYQLDYVEVEMKFRFINVMVNIYCQVKQVVIVDVLVL